MHIHSETPWFCGETSQVYYGRAALQLQNDWELVFRETQLEAIGEKSLHRPQIMCGSCGSGAGSPQPFRTMKLFQQ